MLLHTPCYGWVSNKMAGEYPVLKGAGWALRNTMQTLVVIGNNLSGLVSVGINESILASDHWHQQKKFILILVFPAQHISSWNEMAPTTVPGAKSLKSYFFPALILALKIIIFTWQNAMMLSCGNKHLKCPGWSGQRALHAANLNAPCYLFLLKGCTHWALQLWTACPRSDINQWWC